MSTLIIVSIFYFFQRENLLNFIYIDCLQANSKMKYSVLALLMAAVLLCKWSCYLFIVCLVHDIKEYYVITSVIKSIQDWLLISYLKQEKQIFLASIKSNCFDTYIYLT